MNTSQTRSWNRFIGAGIAAALVLLLFSSCKSLDKPRGADDTLLIIPVSFKGPPGPERWIWHYELEFYGMHDRVVVMPTPKHYVAVTGIPAGRYPLTGLFLVPIGSNNFNNPRTLRYNVPKMLVKTEAGKATLAPFILDSFIEETKPNWFSQRFDIRQVLEDERQVIRDELAAQENFSAWENALEQ
jgi:hypothetical protein